MADRLSADSTAALAAGMSYGKWKALHPHTEYVAPKIKRNVKQIPCAFCGKLFDAGRGKKYCDYDCYYQKSIKSATARKRESRRRNQCR